MKICLIRPEDDGAAKVMSCWWDPTSSYVPSPSELCDVRGPDATRESIELQLQGVDLVLFFGHGTEGALVGGGDLIDKWNVALAAGSVIVAVACRSASLLGAWAVSTGIRSYLGFSEDLLWVDPFEREFGGAVAKGVEAVLRRSSISVSARSLRGGFSELVSFFQSGPGRNHPNAPIAFLAAQWNQDYCVTKGDLDVSLL